MRKLTLTNHVQSDTTVLENEFIDHYMAEANGEYVKVYLILLRHLNEPSGTLTISKIADLLDITEKDVIRALNYWKKKGLLDYDMPVDGEAPAIPAQPRMTEEPSAPEPAAPSIQPAPTTTDVSSIEQYRSRKEFKELLFVAEQYLGKTLSHSDVEAITYFYETLHMSADLIEYLIEYCVENGHTSMHYIQKVALSWCERHIKTVSEAKASSMAYNKNCYSILGAFGIKGRAPAPSEMEYIKRWTSEYGFSLDLILNACARTMNAIHQPSFDYTESILKKWLEQSVKNIQDIETLDAGFIREKEAREKERREKELQRKSAAKITPAPTKFNNFENRSYDMSDLERQAVTAINYIIGAFSSMALSNSSTINDARFMSNYNWITSMNFVFVLMKFMRRFQSFAQLMTRFLL